MMVEGKKRQQHYVEKIIIANEKNSDVIDVWGDGKQTRSFLFVEDCVNATLNFIIQIIMGQ